MSNYYTITLDNPLSVRYVLILQNNFHWYKINYIIFADFSCWISEGTEWTWKPGRAMATRAVIKVRVGWDSLCFGPQTHRTPVFKRKWPLASTVEAKKQNKKNKQLNIAKFPLPYAGWRVHPHVLRPWLCPLLLFCSPFKTQEVPVNKRSEDPWSCHALFKSCVGSNKGICLHNGMK